MGKRKRGNSEGSIYQMKDGRWRAAISIGYRDGKALRKVYTAATRSEVKDKLTKALRDQQEGLPIVGEKETVGHFLAHWLEQVASTKVRPSTLESYRWITERHLMPSLGRYKLARLSAQEIQAFLSERLKSGRQPHTNRTKKPQEPVAPVNSTLSARTVQHIHATLRTALEQALRWNLVARNVATMVEPPRVRRQEVEPYTPDEGRRLLQAVASDRLEALYSAAMALGLRQGEALALKWSDVDFTAGILSVRNSLQRVNGKLQLVEVTTQRSRRTITLPAVAVAALHRHQARQDAERRFAGDRWRASDFIFTTTIGTPLDGTSVTHRFQSILKDAGLRRIRFHDLRHTCATLLLAQGVHPRVIMEILGHSQIAITMNLYAHVIPAMQKEVAAQMDAVLSPAKPVATTVATNTSSDAVN
jgi:integrase